MYSVVLAMVLIPGYYEVGQSCQGTHCSAASVRVNVQVASGGCSSASKHGILKRLHDRRVNRTKPLWNQQAAPQTLPQPKKLPDPKSVGYNPTGCVCGCVTTGNCVCRNCNEPQLKK